MFTEMYEKKADLTTTFLIFFPFQLDSDGRYYLLGDFELCDDNVKLFVAKLFKTDKDKICVGLFNETKWNGDENSLSSFRHWVYVEVKKSVLSVKKFKLEGEFKNCKNYRILWINYNFKAFSQCEILTSTNSKSFSEESYFSFLREKITEKTNNEKIKKTSCFRQVNNMFLTSLDAVFSRPSNYSLKQFFVTKYLNIALHINNYLDGIAWAVKYLRNERRLGIKLMNFLLSIFLDMLLGIWFLYWLNSKVSLDSSPDLFLFTTESVVNSIKDLINWLSGDPAGLKLNRAFNKVLSTFFSFHIDIWWTFIAYLKPLVTIIFQIFLKLGLLGVTFQASILADLLALVSFHVYCIYAYAAKLYSIQISSLISLWRLFFGRKKNPLRGKVDSCVYSPEQLFVGTLGFTILLFLLPTTLLYYIVFTCIRLSILALQAVLMLIMHLNQVLPVYSTILWLKRSFRISPGIEITLHHKSLKSDFILMTVKPVTYSWWETVCYFMPDCAVKPAGFNLPDLLGSLISGKLIYPI